MANYQTTATTFLFYGRLDAWQNPALAQTLKEAVQATNGRININLAGVTFIDQAALSIIERAREDCLSLGGDLYLYEVPEAVSTILAFTRNDRLFRQINALPESR